MVVNSAWHSVEQLALLLVEPKVDCWVDLLVYLLDSQLAKPWAAEMADHWGDWWVASTA